MGGVWRLEEARLVQYRTATSAANADLLQITSGCPAGKLWVVTGFAYQPSVGETQVIAFEKASTQGNFALLNPVSMALNPAYATFIEQGMEYMLFPGEAIIARRGNHTAGSTMTCWMQLIEIDLPLYTYDEPQIVKRQQQARGSILQQLGRGASGSGASGPVAPGVSRKSGGGSSSPPAA